MFVIPKKGYKIPDPALNDYLPEDGRDVEESHYWYRRLRDGDVVAKSKEEPSGKQEKNLKKEDEE